MKAVCGICPHACALEEGQFGFCRARVCRNGSVECNSYGRITSLALDPIEKKPLREYMPGSLVLSLGSYGCNLHCAFCQNSEISQADARTAWRELSPHDLLRLALSLVVQGNIGAAYTYNEPLVGFEYVFDCARLLRENGLKNVLVTNGFANETPFNELIGLIDAANIDLKSFSDDFYTWIGGSLDTVKRNIVSAASRCHVEVTALIIPGKNDSPDEMDELSRWLAGVDKNIPLHISRFFPRYRLTDIPPTPVETVYALADIAKQHLKSVYTGNC